MTFDLRDACELANKSRRLRPHQCKHWITISRWSTGVSLLDPFPGETFFLIFTRTGIGHDIRKWLDLYDL
jgi:hypothetical protein